MLGKSASFEKALGPWSVLYWHLEGLGHVEGLRFGLLCVDYPYISPIYNPYIPLVVSIFFSIIPINPV